MFARMIVWASAVTGLLGAGIVVGSELTAEPPPEAKGGDTASSERADRAPLPEKELDQLQPDPERLKDEVLLQRPPADEWLTVGQTLGFVFTRFFEGGPIHPYRYAHSGAREPLHRVLENEDLAKYHDKAWKTLGYIGEASDLGRLEESLWNDFQGVLSGPESDALDGMFGAVGLMVARDVEGAQELADRMMTPEYWRRLPFRWQEEQAQDSAGPVYRTIARFLRGYALSLDPRVPEQARKIVEGIQDPDRRRQVQKLLGPESVEEMLAGAQTWHAHTDRPVTQQERREFLSMFNGDLQNPAPSAGGPREIGDVRLKPAAAEFDADTERRQRKPPSAAQRLQRIAYRFSMNADGQLDSLDFYGRDVTNETLALLDAAPQLRFFDLAKTAVTDKGLRHLKNLEHLQDLGIARSEKITDQGLRHIADLSTLTDLNLFYLPNVTNQGLRHLKSLENLEYLALKRTDITDEGLKHLEGLTSLKTLHITGVHITGRGLKHLAGLKNLDVLRLRGVSLTNEGLQELHEFQHLERLVLGRTSSKAYQAQYTVEALQRLREALPDTEIIAPEPE